MLFVICAILAMLAVPSDVIKLSLNPLSFNIEIVKKITFIDLYWFPITVIITTVIIIVVIKWYSVRHPEVEKKDRKGAEKDKKKAKSKKDQKNGKKDMSKQEK